MRLLVRQFLSRAKKAVAAAKAFFSVCIVLLPLRGSVVSPNQAFGGYAPPIIVLSISHTSWNSRQGDVRFSVRNTFRVALKLIENSKLFELVSVAGTVIQER